MLRRRAIVMAGVLALTVAAATPTRAVDSVDHAATHELTAVEKHLKFLGEKLQLTREQQQKLKPILQELNDATAAISGTPNLTEDERGSRLHEAFWRADKKARVHLNAEQQKKLDQLEHESHPDLHGQGKVDAGQ